MSLIRLLDISGLFWPIWRAKEAAGRPIGEAATETVQLLRRYASAGDVDHVVACCDSGRSFRHEIALEYRALFPDFKGYKAHRPEKDSAMMTALSRVIDELEQDGVPIMRAQGFEADDVIATITAWAHTSGHDVEIVSEDKDLLQLVRDSDADGGGQPGVWVVRRDGTRQDQQGCIDRLGVPPQIVAPFLALNGDKSDGVIGVPEVGGTWASRLLWGRMVDGQWRPSPFRSFQAIVDAAIQDQAELEQSERARAEAKANKVRPLPPEYKPKFPENVRKSLIQNAAAFDIGLRLTALRVDVPLDFAQVTAPRVPKPKVDTTTIDPELKAFFDEQENTVNQQPSEAEIVPSSNQAAEPANDQTPPPVASPPSQATPAASVVEITAPKKPDQALAVVQTQAMAAPSPSREFERQLEPSNFVQAVKLAEAIAKSRKLKDMNDVNEVLLQMVMGRSIGLNLFQSLCQFYIVEGKGTMAAQLVAARVRQHPRCEFFRKRSGDKASATWESKIKGDSRVMTWTFTIQDAKDAKLGGSDKNPQGNFDPKSNWAKYPAQMCSWRAALFLAREEWPEITAGIYDPDEIREQREAPSMEDAA